MIPFLPGKFQRHDPDMDDIPCQLRNVRGQTWEVFLVHLSAHSTRRDDSLYESRRFCMMTVPVNTMTMIMNWAIHVLVMVLMNLLRSSLSRKVQP